jgi:hypothetical protein
MVAGYEGPVGEVALEGSDSLKGLNRLRKKGE